MKNPVLPSLTEAEAEKHIKDYVRLATGRMQSYINLLFLF